MYTKVLAIHLPQFHTIPENNEWWGEGFTEWNNVKRGKPFYRGHYQPREPLNDDYYDLADLTVLEKQIRLARKSGIYGFCFYHYYFNGKKLLEKPIENYRDNSKEKFPYCLIWANQSWARTWYRAKLGNKVLINQDYGNRDDWERHFYYLLKFFKDDRYIQIDGKPVYIIYLPQDIPFRRQMFSLWRRLAIQNGFKGLYLIAMDTWASNDSTDNFYDAYMNFEPLHTFKNDSSYRKFLYNWNDKVLKHFDKANGLVRWLFAKDMYTYSFICKKIAESNRKKVSKKTFIGVFPGWDNTARKDEEGWIVRGSTPKKFGHSLKDALINSEERGNEFVFINAWNEWSEGAYLEPDKRYGYAYLNEIKKVIRAFNQADFKAEPVLLMTATIVPQERRFLKVCNVRQRLEEYIDSLLYYITETTIKEIVFCDNSNYEFDRSKIYAMAEKYEKSIEIIQFSGSRNEIAQNGKGFGEGEIIKYALSNSRLLLNADYFIKVTGRVKIKNIEKIKDNLCPDKMYFNKSVTAYQLIDTMMFCIPKKRYLNYFVDVYRQVCDKKDRSIEHVIRDTITGYHLKFSNLPFYPIIEGQSGTTGKPYQEKRKITYQFLNLLSKLNLFNCNSIYTIVFYLLHKI